ncbi:TlpA family protein disulfide reductase [Paraburkholderia caballeronis]|uniref:Thiol-disulfide isomerase or thioredoxin n=1 Tax=Paraburkholderia caballeronis TaxID=416943 RepID=A0A1H7PYQ3_9BURK|nr:TlpA disulfide reductase family protein [Paraburkholderia caballeronis]PXW24413.1 thiol-disulfide isomerase/thioredoxin [Paraburkholderia caballeronis]PXX00195.1 thiol-disulfide isomerase/thioredoxin [Paraburkholderia caballeronis]RAJ97324.1 thiol-disulfide isomerase/thioredoxin [Paraburkholderia caballeronis]TDV09844.1 thiol-disulfide isomerase/thioredoxin [Paraburkholderia caballeronis]TDV14089.1 thiol-disulfide isomerase/thioredoxin [Paraburkholderia caballeronis]
MNRQRILAAATVAAVAAGASALAGLLPTGLSGTAHAASAAVQPDAVGQLWTAAVTNADGKPQSLAPYKGRPIVVNFWASWCGPCVQEMPELSALQREYAKKGIQFVGLGVDSAANVKAFLQKVKVDYPVYIAGFGGADIARAFGNNAGGLPFTVVIDAKGAVRSTKLGQVKPDELRHTLDAL